MTTPAEITTPRMLLTSITPALIHGFFEQKTREEISRYFGVDEAGYDHLKHMHENGIETHRISLFYFLLLDKGTKRVLGECGFHTWNRTHRRAELFYSLRNDADKRQGLMKEALRQVLDFGFTALGLHRIEALAAAENTPSIRLLEHYGFTKEGTMREDYVVNGKSEDSECYSLLRWEWDNNKDHRK